MEEAYVVCEERNNEAAYRRFFGPGYLGTHGVVRMALRHRVTTGILLAMFALGLAGCVAVLTGVV